MAYGAASSQSTVDNSQEQDGAVFAGQTLNVVTSSDDTATTTATGNAFSGSVVAGDLDMTSQQTLTGTSGALNNLNVAQYAGSGTVTTAATGNTGDATVTSGGTLTGQVTQSVTSSAVSANSNVNAGNAQIGQGSFETQAIANSQSFVSGDSAVNASVSQLNQADTTATGNATIGYMPGDAVFTAGAVGNNVTSIGAGAASQSLGIAQSNQSSVVQAVQITGLGDSQNTLTNATASANNVNITNEQGPLGVAVNQDNEAAVIAYGEEDALQFGGATVTAQAVGNSTLAGNVGTSVALDNVQVNGTGGVDSTVTINGGSGFDMAGASTAIGNAATAYACSECGGVMDITNSQTNGSDVSAKSIIGITGDQARSISGTTTAVGNSASFYVTKPGG